MEKCERKTVIYRQTTVALREFERERWREVAEREREREKEGREWKKGKREAE